MYNICLQCFDIVGRVRGRASNLKNYGKAYRWQCGDWNFVLEFCY